MKKINIVIPVKKTSERVKNKNFKKFINNKSLFEILIQKLKSCSFVDNIYVSSNHVKMEKKINKLGCIYIHRKDKYCNNKIPWSEMIYHTVDALPLKSMDDLAWCHTTTPLFNNYTKVINKYFDIKKSKKYNSLLTVSKFNEFIVSDKMRPINYAWGP